MSKAKELLSENIRRLRKANGWTQRDLADRIGVAESTVSYWESAQFWVDADSLDRLAETFSVPHTVLLSGSDATPPKATTRRKPTLREALEIINESDMLLTIKPRKTKSRQVKNS